MNKMRAMIKVIIPPPNPEAKKRINAPNQHPSAINLFAMNEIRPICSSYTRNMIILF